MAADCSSGYVGAGDGRPLVDSAVALNRLPPWASRSGNLGRAVWNPHWEVVSCVSRTPSLGPFSPDDLLALTQLVIETWHAGLDRDRSVPAGTLDWSCRRTAEHTVDTVFAPALFLASRNQHAYPAFEDL